MNGYPKHIATVQDYRNLLAVPEFRDRALADLRAVLDADDDTTRQVVSISEDGAETIAEIENPMPRWKVKGFESRTAVAALLGGAS